MGAIFSSWMNLITRLCFICSFRSDIILSDCLSAICHPATLEEYWWEDSASTAIPPTIPLTLWVNIIQQETFFFSEQPFVNRCTFQNHLLLHSFMHLAICNHFFIYLFFFYFFFSLLFLLFSNQFKRNLAANSKNILVIYMGIVSQKKAF